MVKDYRYHSVLLGLIVGYFSLILGAITGQEIVFIYKGWWSILFHLPPMSLFLRYDVKFTLVILTMAPIAFVTMTEHFGQYVMVLNSLTGKDFFLKIQA